MDPDYHLFANVVETGSLSGAARAMAISPAMASKRLARLEARLGVRLVHRTTRRLALTDIGERFHADVTAILSSVQAAEDRVTGARTEPAGTLRISAPTSFGRLYVAPRLHLFLERHPRVTLDINLSDGFVDLFAERVDLAIRITPNVPANLVAHRLGSSRRILCAAPKYGAEHGWPRDVAELSNHCLLAAEGQLPWRLVSGAHTALVDRPSLVRTNSSEIVRELALTGVGVALRSLWDVSDAVADGRLVRVLPEWEGTNTVGVYAMHPPTPAPVPAISAFIDFLRAALDPAPWDLA